MYFKPDVFVYNISSNAIVSRDAGRYNIHLHGYLQRYDDKVWSRDKMRFDLDTFLGPCPQ